MNQISPCWSSIKCTLLSIQLKYCNLQHRPPIFMYCGLDDGVHIQQHPHCFSVGFIIYSVAHNIYHKQCNTRFQFHPNLPNVSQASPLYLDDSLGIYLPRTSILGLKHALCIIYQMMFLAQLANFQRLVPQTNSGFGLSTLMFTNCRGFGCFLPLVYQLQTGNISHIG